MEAGGTMIHSASVTTPSVPKTTDQSLPRIAGYTSGQSIVPLINACPTVDQ